MKTYLTVLFNSSGKTPSEITHKLSQIGFLPEQGNYDYSYDWDSKISPEEVIRTADRIQQALKGYNLTFKLETM